MTSSGRVTGEPEVTIQNVRSDFLFQSKGSEDLSHATALLLTGLVGAEAGGGPLFGPEWMRHSGEACGCGANSHPFAMHASTYQAKRLRTKPADPNTPVASK